MVERTNLRLCPSWLTIPGGLGRIEGMTAPVESIDPRTGQVVEVVTHESTPNEVDAACAAATAAGPALEEAGPQGRSRMLRLMADELETDADKIVELADRESALGEPRLRGELARSGFQLRLFAGVLDDGAYLNVTIDHADPEAAPIPRPDLRRMLVPLGPVGVFGASNFPLAFSVPGGDTASALAAGCPVVVKAHPAHPATSQRCLEALQRGAVGAGLPLEVVSAIHGGAAGADMVRHPAIQAVGFTGSVAGGRALFDLACARPDPIPFYGELGSLNPVVITAAAAAERADEIAAGLYTSFTNGVGQFCTKPGVVFVPAGADGQRLEATLAEATRGYQPGAMLGERIRDGFRAGSDERAGLAGVTVLAESSAPDGGGFFAPARLVSVPARTLLDGNDRATLLDECFGPLTVLVEYADDAELLAALAHLPGSLTATVHAASAEAPTAAIDLLRRRAGRLVWNGYPTGVAVTWAQQHGGPYPSSTNSRSTSVGTAAIERWLRPVAYQSVPDQLLPEALQEANPWRLPRRVDGVLQLP
jgi:NADP-dependent aldehyde dehydrogenase